MNDQEKIKEVFIVAWMLGYDEGNSEPQVDESTRWAKAGKAHQGWLNDMETA